MKKFVALSIALALAAPALHAQEPVSFMSVRECGRMGFAFLADAPLRVAAVLPGAPADRAGLRPNDVVVRIDGDEASPERIKLIADTLMPGDTVRLRVRRGATSATSPSSPPETSASGPPPRTCCAPG